ncbi:hypothetical protein MLD38_008016 [Melastoma candidum]|uniref:Uncharacterized protein n=1 Tax=Melastoma candidum TaxID=119954 RepID=A0ACB9RUU6_9MYRT|nr:hypothetical protein MLD38_008016 [Melastoma candidum]
MPSRLFPPPSSHLAEPNTFAKSRVLFPILTVSSSVVIVLAVIYLLYYFYYHVLYRSRTIPLDSGSPLNIVRYSLKEIRSATQDFHEANVIGKGGSGTVFKGILKDGKLVAVKRLDAASPDTGREFQNELQILGVLRSPFLVTLLGYCVEKEKRMLVYEYMPNRSLQELLFCEGEPSLSWDRRFSIVLDVARALEFLHLGCDPPVIHGDIKPGNVLLDSDYRAKVSDFGLSRMKANGDFGADVFNQDLGHWKSQDLSGTLTAETPPVIGTPVETSTTMEVDFALALQASSSSKRSRGCCNPNVKPLNFNSTSGNDNVADDGPMKGVVEGNPKGKEVSVVVDVGCDDWRNRFVPYDDDSPGSKQWGKDWWWRQDGSGELCSKDYVMEWIGSQISPSTDPDWDDEGKNFPERPNLSNPATLDKSEDVSESHDLEHGAQTCDKELSKGCANGARHLEKKHRKMQEWWKDERVADMRKERKKSRILEMKLKRGVRLPHFDLGRRFYFHNRKKSLVQNERSAEANGEFSFRRGFWKKDANSNTSDMWSGDLFSRELSSTTSMRGTLCYVAPEYGGCGYMLEKADVYSLGVLILVIVSGRRPLHVLASPMKLEKANLISWCRHLAQAGDVLELVDERLNGEYSKEQATLCINLALFCLQKLPELRPDIGEIVKTLRGEMDLPQLPLEFSPSPPSKIFGRSRRKQKKSTE